MKLNSLAMALTLLVAVTPVVHSKDVDVDASISTDKAFLGEPIRLTVRVNNFKTGMEPDLSRIPDCAIEYLGHGDQSFRNISIINGRRESTGFSGRVFEYNVTPAAAGTRNLGPITVASGKNVTRIPGPRVTIQDAVPQKHVLVDLNVSKSEVVVDEPFSVELRVRVRALPAPYADVSPLPVESPPLLSIPYLKQDAFETLEGPNISDLLNGMLIKDRRSPGLAINGVSLQQNFFGGFLNMRAPGDRPPAARFDFKPTRIQHNGDPYLMYALTLEYTPTSEGMHTFGPVSFKGRIFKAVTSAGRGVTESIFAITDPQTVRIVPPPELGRPASYIGGIGHTLMAKSSLDAQTCYVGDPLTLEIVISGDIRKENLFAPRLSLQETLGKDFRIYEDSVHSATRDGARVYKYTVRPSRAGTLEFPPIAVSFYNTETRRYETVLTDPIPVRANPAVEVEGSIVIDTSIQSVTIMTEEADPNASVPAPFDASATLSRTEMLFTPRLHLPILLVGPLLFLVGSLLLVIRRHLPRAARYRQQLTASSHALSRLAEIPDMTEAFPSEARQAIVAAMRTYIEMRFGIAASALTPPDLSAILSTHNVPRSLSDPFVELLARNFNAGFQSDTQSLTSIDTDTKEACQIILGLEEQLKETDKTTPHGLATIIKQWLSILAFTLLAASTTQAKIAPPSFESQLAMSQLAMAKTPDQFDRVAQTFERMLDMGLCNAPLLYNYGTALLMAERPQEALHALLRAERYSGTTWELKRNMLLATHMLDDAVMTPRLPWYRTLLFWHYRMSGHARITIASLAFLFVWIALFLRQLGLTNLSRPILGITLTLLIVFGSSAATTLYQELRPQPLPPTITGNGVTNPTTTTEP